MTLHEAQWIWTLVMLSLCAIVIMLWPDDDDASRF